MCVCDCVPIPACVLRAGRSTSRQLAWQEQRGGSCDVGARAIATSRDENVRRSRSRRRSGTADGSLAALSTVRYRHYTLFTFRYLRDLAMPARTNGSYMY